MHRGLSKKKKSLGIIDAGILTTTMTQITPTSLQHVKTDYTTQPKNRKTESGLNFAIILIRIAMLVDFEASSLCCAPLLKCQVLFVCPPRGLGSSWLKQVLFFCVPLCFSLQ